MKKAENVRLIDADEVLMAINRAREHAEAKGKPLLMSRVALLLASYFQEGAEDDHILAVEADGTIETGKVGISCCFQTKLFDFGYPERFKRINPFYLQITGAEGEMLNLTYLNGNGGCLDVCSPMMTGGSLEERAPIRITPNAVRVREFGIRVEGESRVEVGSLTMNYSMMGTVR